MTVTVCVLSDFECSVLTDSLIETTLRSLSQSRVCGHVARAYEFPVHVSQGERGTADGSDGRPRRRSRMGCLLSRPYELSPRLLRDLAAGSEGTSHAQHLLVPPRPVRHELGWSDLSSVQLISASGGSCDIFAAVLDGESVAVKRVNQTPQTPSVTCVRRRPCSRSLVRLSLTSTLYA